MAATVEVFQGQTLRITATIVDKDGAAYNPSESVDCQLKDTTGTVVRSYDGMDKIVDGSYEYLQDFADDAALGRWWVGVRGIDGAVALDESYGEMAIIVKERRWE